MCSSEVRCRHDLELISEGNTVARIEMSALGQKQTLEPTSRMSALPPKADMRPGAQNVRLVPIADIRSPSGSDCRGPTGHDCCQSLRSPFPGSLIPMHLCFMSRSGGRFQPSLRFKMYVRRWHRWARSGVIVRTAKGPDVRHSRSCSSTSPSNGRLHVLIAGGGGM